MAVLEEAYRQIGLTEQQSAIPKNLQTLMDVLVMKFKMIEEDCKADYMQTFFPDEDASCKAFLDARLYTANPAVYFSTELR